VIHRDPFKAGTLQSRTVIVQDRAGRGGTQGATTRRGWAVTSATNRIKSNLSIGH
jgi:hypothetical protein